MKNIYTYGKVCMITIFSIIFMIPLSAQSNPRDMEFVFVEGGTFQMEFRDHKSVIRHTVTVTVSSFYIGKYEVTQEEYGAVVENKPSGLHGDNPVERVSWYDAVEFCNKKSRSEGLTPCYSGSGKSIKCDFSANGYRLPTEAEWQFAALGGNQSKGYKYAGSNNCDAVAWDGDNDGIKTHQVGLKLPNELGIYDMSGNVLEWCNDWWQGNTSYYKTNPVHNPRGPAQGGPGYYHMARGGAWCYMRYCSLVGFRSLGGGWVKAFACSAVQIDIYHDFEV